MKLDIGTCYILFGLIIFLSGICFNNTFSFLIGFLWLIFWFMVDFDSIKPTIYLDSGDSESEITEEV